MPPRVKPKAGRRRAAVRYGNRHSVDALDINNRNGRAEGVQQSDKDDDISPPLRKRRRKSVKALSAKFTEWLLETAVVRSAIVDGVTTFQLQFKADLYCSKHSRRVLGGPQSDCGSNSPAKWHNSKPGPIAGALTSGKTPPVPQSDDDVQSLLLTEDAEWEVDKILETRKRGRGSQILVKWVGFEKPTWGPLRNFLGTEALGAYMAEHEDIPSLSASGGPGEDHVVR
ncbi:hypothetical protein KVR01_000357 [Diaporthe batatas]|uniref:uncharacterized protein n=1 Tax=Diaporthe batatas TaxID=748121 RepID=UPI001D04A2FC|nr:uncharacterized protein KVR01_000357 [Diaporthe batatas]KAG8169612.1 hypothetical protein KVR01_000357 [Diaporthe batatas]